MFYHFSRPYSFALYFFSKKNDRCMGLFLVTLKDRGIPKWPQHSPCSYQNSFDSFSFSVLYLLSIPLPTTIYHCSEIPKYNLHPTRTNILNSNLHSRKKRSKFSSWLKDHEHKLLPPRRTIINLQ